MLFGLGNKFLDVTPKGKAKISKWDDIELKSFCTAKETTDEMKKQLMEWEKTFVNDIPEE